jgi:hypothetical protein
MAQPAFSRKSVSTSSASATSAGSASRWKWPPGSVCTGQPSRGGLSLRAVLGWVGAETHQRHGRVGAGPRARLRQAGVDEQIGDCRSVGRRPDQGQERAGTAVANEHEGSTDGQMRSADAAARTCWRQNGSAALGALPRSGTTVSCPPRRSSAATRCQVDGPTIGLWIRAESSFLPSVLWPAKYSYLDVSGDVLLHAVGPYCRADNWPLRSAPKTRAGTRSFVTGSSMASMPRASASTSRLRSSREGQASQRRYSRVESKTWPTPCQGGQTVLRLPGHRDQPPLTSARS